MSLSHRVLLCLCLAILIAVSKQADDALKADVATNGLSDDLTKADEYEKAAVATDCEECSKIGKDILKDEGSAVDSAVATLICLGTVQFASSGIGGGGFLIYYDKDKKKTYAYDFRETVPKKSNEDEFKKDSLKAANGPLSVAIPSEIKGLRAAWKKHGKLDWEKLIEPSIKLAKDGFKATKFLAEHAKRRFKKIKDPFLKRLITEEDGASVKEGTLIKRPTYAKTLEIIKDNPEDMYEGELAKKLVEDIEKKGGIITEEDLKGYEVKTPDPVEVELDDSKLYTLPLPSGGPVLAHMLSMFKGYDFKKEDFESTEKIGLTYHRIVEVFKFSHSYRPYLCDPDFPTDKDKCKKMAKDILDKDAAEKQRKDKIDDEETKDVKYYTEEVSKKEDRGTTHISILAENGDAVAATSSLNFKFGALFASESTGIVLNNQLEDLFIFDSPEKKYTSGKENGVIPGARPLSSMAPSIIVDKDDKVQMVIGASGGNRITLATAYVILMTNIGMDIGNAVMMSRPYHSFFPTYIRNEKKYSMKEEIVEELKKRKHTVKNSNLDAAVQAIHVKDGKIFAKSDPRKYGKTDGY